MSAVEACPGAFCQVDGDYHYDSRKQVLLWSIDLIDDTNRSGSMEFVIGSAASSDAFFPVDVSFSAQHTLADVSISAVRDFLRALFASVHLIYIAARLLPRDAVPCCSGGIWSQGPACLALRLHAPMQHTGTWCVLGVPRHVLVTAIVGCSFSLVVHHKGIVLPFVQVLAVDDDQPVKYATRSTLQTDGYQVV